eukprot:2561110-Rhodomonas_salina.1
MIASGWKELLGLGRVPVASPLSAIHTSCCSARGRFSTHNDCNLVPLDCCCQILVLTIVLLSSSPPPQLARLAPQAGFDNEDCSGIVSSAPKHSSRAVTVQTTET